MGNADLGIYACMFVAFYSILTCLGGWYFFDESLGIRQYIGIIVSLMGAMILSI